MNAADFFYSPIQGTRFAEALQEKVWSLLSLLTQCRDSKT